VIFILAVLFLATGSFLLANSLWFKLPGIPGSLEGNMSEAGQPVDSITVLLLGTDSRPGETVGRTDTIIVARVDTAENRLSLLSIPRDTRVNIPKHGMDKINSANVYGGPILTARVVSDLIGMPVQYYALTNWEGFKEMVDTLGGITIDVEKRMYYYDRADGPEYIIDLQPGVQRLDGRKALQYVRFRKDALGDISRTGRQLKFLTALAHEIMQPDTILKLPRLIPQVNNCLSTNLAPRQLVALARTAKNLDQLATITQTLPGRFSEQDGISYWTVDLRQAHQVARALFEDGQVTEVIQNNTVNKEVYPAKIASSPLKTGAQSSPVPSGQSSGTPGDNSKQGSSSKKESKTPETSGSPDATTGPDEPPAASAGDSGSNTNNPGEQPVSEPGTGQNKEDAGSGSISKDIEIILIPSDQNTTQNI
jgi:LCP family protein required for cell wall assembly